MKRSSSLALLAAGRVSDSLLLRIPSLADYLGPIRSSSLRLASRIANILGAGHPVDSTEAFTSSETIIISVPSNWLPQVVDDLVEAPLDWKSKTVLMCDSDLDSCSLNKLAFAGAETGSISQIHDAEENLFVIEGSRKALRIAKHLLQAPGIKIVTMDSGRKPLFDAAISFATTLALPLITASAETLRACGMEQNDSYHVADKLFQRTLRTYLKAGRKGWEGALPDENSSALRQQMIALMERSPLLASYFFENAVRATEILRQNPTWIKAMENDVFRKAAGD